MINEQTKYATEILGFLATYHVDTPVYRDEMLESLGTVPKEFGKKIFTKLSREKIILTKPGRGMGCGIRMNKEKLSVSLWDLVSLFNPPRHENGGFTSGFGEFYNETMDRLETELSQRTILDLVRDQRV